MMCVRGEARKILSGEELGQRVVIKEGERYYVRLLMCMCDVCAWGR